MNAEKKYSCSCGNHYFTVVAKNVNEALEYAVKRFDDESSLTDDVTVVRWEEDGYDWTDSKTYYI